MQNKYYAQVQDKELTILNYLIHALQEYGLHNTFF